jgi:hypothetical protein
MLSITFRAAAITALAFLTPSILADGADAASWPTGIEVAPAIKENIKALYHAVNDPKGSLDVAATFTPNGSFVEDGMTFEGHTGQFVSSQIHYLMRSLTRIGSRKMLKPDNGH